MEPSITVQTTGGRLPPRALDELTLKDYLAVHSLPGNLFQAYVNEPGGPARPAPNGARLNELPATAEVVLRCMMNPDFSEFMNSATTRNCREGAVTELTEVQFGVEGCKTIVHELDATTARDVVGDRVRNYAGQHCAEPVILAGVSGGGDSNALIGPLATALRNAGQELIAFTLVSEPIWPETSAIRAAALCRRHRVRHEVLGSFELAELLGMRTDVPALYHSFLERYGPATSHFLATFLISAAARRLCQRHKTHEYCLAFNREDLLAELLFSVMNGRRPLAFPIRRFGLYRLLMPVWEIPKRVLDACYPDYSLENYEHRISTTPQRGLIYFLAHAIEDIHPNLGLSLMQGLREIFADQWKALERDEAFDIYPDSLASQAELAEARAFLAEHFKVRGSGA